MILIPAHNEVTSITDVVYAAQRHCQQPVVVIDDCSQDDTAKLASAAGAIVLPLAIPLGAWCAIQTGLRFAKLHEWPIAVTLDADGQHEPAHVAELIAPIRAGYADVVIGSHPERVGPVRSAAWRYFRWLTGISVEDLTSGFRAYNRVAIERLARADASLLDYQDIGLLILLREQGLRATEVPVNMAARANGRSRIFHSWGAVVQYMMYTSVLCLASSRRNGNRRLSRRRNL
jgi:glycosyltransferase involved in cell wall biosynthesis